MALKKRRYGKKYEYQCDKCGVWIPSGGMKAHKSKDNKYRCNPERAKKTREALKKASQEVNRLFRR